MIYFFKSVSMPSASVLGPMVKTFCSLCGSPPLFSNFYRTHRIILISMIVTTILDIFLCRTIIPQHLRS